MTIQVVIKFQISNFEFLGVPQEKSLGRPHIKNPKNIILKAISIKNHPFFIFSSRIQHQSDNTSTERTILSCGIAAPKYFSIIVWKGSAGVET